MSGISCQDVVIAFGRRTVLHDVSVRAGPGMLTGILGCNGAGKSTLLRVLLGYLAPIRGTVYLDGKPLSEWSDRERAARMAYIAQDHHVQWPMQVEHIVALGRMPHGYGRGVGLGKLSGADRRAIDAAMVQADIAHLADRTVDELSNGERVRVLLARAFASEPVILLADEPLAGLDPAYQLHVSQLLHRQARAGKTVALVLHDLAIAARYCDELILLHAGRVLAAGAPVEVLSERNLRVAFGIEALRFEHDGQQCLMPWRVEQKSKESETHREDR